MRRSPRFSPLSALLACASGALFAAPPTEQDYFTELPEVLTVTRLAQPLSETPGAVTVIDRDTIRRSGARTVADLLRLVPGYIVSGFNGTNPVGVYHSSIDDFGVRNQVLVDGRSVYSSYFLGDTHRGMMSIALEDIERIEVLRGSNSAAYGANAFLGVINVVTRHAADTYGAVISATSGEEGIADGYARYGWGTGQNHFRLSAARMADHGYRNAYDDGKVEQVHFRADLVPSADSELMLAAGFARTTLDEGFAGSGGDPLRTAKTDSFFMHGNWRKSLAPDRELRVSASMEEELLDHRVKHGTLPVMLDYGGRGRRMSLELQYTQAFGDAWRVVGGVAMHRESAESVPLYHVPKVDMYRHQLFGNVEWRPHARWVVNAGGLVEKHSLAGTEFAPRLAANFLAAGGHTLRIAATQAFRSPSLYELKADTRYYHMTTGAQVGRTRVATGGVQAESVESRELGYLGEFRRARFVVDVRAYEERLKGLIRGQNYTLLPSLALTGTTATDYVNNPGYRIRGIEYQMRWKPLDGTEIWLNQSVQKTTHHTRPQDSLAVPRHITTLGLFQRLQGNAEFTAIVYALDTMSHRSPTTDLMKYDRLDLRLAYPFRVGATRVELALMVQSAYGNYPVFMPSEKFEFPRRAFGTLRIEF